MHVFNTAIPDPAELMARGVARGGAPVRFLTTFHEPRNLIEEHAEEPDQAMSALP